jgi:beta-lactamase regulating signal transducer with metallopeptidase domain
MIAWLALNIVWASAAMLLVLALRQPAARLFGAGIAYALWLVPALRLIQPPLPAWHGAIPSVASPETLVVFVEGTAAPLPPDGGPGQWVPILLAIWAGGAAAFILWQWLAYRAFLARISRGARRIGAHRGLPIVASEGAEGPLALGLVERRIVVPADFETRYAPTERVLALDHGRFTTAAATCGGTSRRCSSSPSTGSTRSPGSPFARSAPTRSWPAMRQ